VLAFTLVVTIKSDVSPLLKTHNVYLNVGFAEEEACIPNRYNI
jgi:hypothetical protein